MDVTMKNTDIHLVLAGLKLLESRLTTENEWANASKTNKLHTSLQKQVFGFNEEKSYE